MTELYYNASNFIVTNGFVKNPQRYYLEEFFSKCPDLNAVLNTDFSDTNATATANTTIRLAEQKANKDFELISTNTSAALSANGGITMTTGTTTNNSGIILPHLLTGLSAWTSCTWSTSKELEWDCAFKTDSNIGNICIWAGLKISNTPAIATDANQAYFIFSTNDDLVTLSDNTHLHFVYKAGGTNYITDLGLEIATSTLYRLKIKIDSAKKLSIFVNEAQYGIFNTATGNGTTVSDATQKSNALDDANLIPYIGIRTLTNAARILHVCYVKMSKAL